MYKELKTLEGVVMLNMIQRTADNATIPFDPANTDYQACLKWLEEGNEPKPADIPPVVIPDISMRQARLALLQDGLLDDIESGNVYT